MKWEQISKYCKENVEIKTQMQNIPGLGKWKVMIWSFELPPKDELGSCTHT